MRRSTAAISGAAWFVLEAGTFVGLVPWLITHWAFHRPWPFWVVAQVVGVSLICAGLVPVVHAFIQFGKAGASPIPLAPMHRLVVTGFHSYVRNPIYVGSVMIFAGESLLFGRLRMLLYAAVGWGAAAAFVHWHEEPTLARQFGAEYETYRRAVPAWRPRLHPWTRPDNDESGPH
jgi:protein-S-isoprenylcysteine O-methyltransferase Ste14